jgi:DNA helicase HerA-like ATPase
LTNIATRCAGLVTNDGGTSDLPFGSFRDRTVYVIDVALLEEDAQDLIFARVVSKLREHLERRDLGVQHVVVFVDELNKYAPGDGPDTYVRKMLLDVAERGRYLGLVLFAAQQFRSQVHRRVVGNAGTALFGRMDGDELATPGYATLGPALRTKLATLEKGQLMVRHPHFAQPVFVRFPRPAVLTGRLGAERYPPSTEPALDVAVTRALRAIDPGVTLGWVQDTIALVDDADVLRAKVAVEVTRPQDVKGFFRATLRTAARVAAPVASSPAPAVPLKTAPDDDPYGF